MPFGLWVAPTLGVPSCEFWFSLSTAVDDMLSG